MVQTVKTLLSKNSNTRSFQEVLADLRATRIGTGLPSPAEILHGRNPATKEACHVDYKAIRAVLQERQLKMKLSHDKSHRAKKARPLVTGERCYCLGPKDKWLECFIVGICDTGRSYDIQIEATGTKLTRNRSHIRPRSPDIPLLHDSFLQVSKRVPSEEPCGELNSNENSVLSAASSPPKREQIASRKDTSNSVLSGPRNISKPTLTSKVLVSDTATRSQPDRRAKQTRFKDNPVSSIKAIPARTVKTKCPSPRHRSPLTFDVTDPDLLIPLRQVVTESIPDQVEAPTITPSPSASPSATLQLSSSETTTKEPSVVLPVSQETGSDTTSKSSSESSSGTSSSSEASSTMTSPSTGTTSASSSTSTSPEMLEMERSIGSIISQERGRLGHAVTRNTINGAKQRILVMQRQIEQQPKRPVSAPPIASQPLPPYPRRRLSDMGSKSKVQAGNATAPRTSTPETGDRLQDIKEEPRRRIGPSRVRELARYFTPPSPEDDPTRINTNELLQTDITRSLKDQVKMPSPSV